MTGSALGVAGCAFGQSGRVVWTGARLGDPATRVAEGLYAALCRHRYGSIFALTAVIVSLLAFLLTGGFRNGWRALFWSLAIFAGIAVVIKLMELDHGGLPIVDTRQWGGLLVTLVVSLTGIVASMPVGIALGAWATLDHSADQSVLDYIHRILARRSVDHGAVLRDLYAAAVSCREILQSMGSCGS